MEWTATFLFEIKTGQIFSPVIVFYITVFKYMIIRVLQVIDHYKKGI